MTAFDLLSAPRLSAPGKFSCVVPEGWAQGRGLFGGFATAMLTRALEAQAPERTLRSLTAELCGPIAPGEVTFEVETLREGSAVTTCAAKLLQGGQVQAHAVGVLGKVRTRERDGVFLEKPTWPDWRQMEPLEIGPPLGPEFLPHFEFRAERFMPMEGNTERGAEGWIRLKEPGSRRDAAFLAAMIDAWWPTMLTVEETPRPMATIAFTFQPFVHFEGLDLSAPLFFRARQAASSDGYFVELRELWGEDGRLLALNQQTFCIIK
jgi:hypothetical protein